MKSFYHQGHEGTQRRINKLRKLVRVPLCPWWLILLLPSRAVYESFDAVFQVSNIEVYEKSEGSSTEFQVGNDLRLMNGSNRVHRFQFDDDQIFHQEIDSVAEIQLNAIVNLSLIHI